MPPRTIEAGFRCRLDKGERLKIFKPKSCAAHENFTRYEFQVDGVKLGLIWRTLEGTYAAEWGRRDHPSPESAIAELKRIVSNNKERHVNNHRSSNPSYHG